jgi:hypothetical protein
MNSLHTERSFPLVAEILAPPYRTLESGVFIFRVPNCSLSKFRYHTRPPSPAGREIKAYKVCSGATTMRVCVKAKSKEIHNLSCRLCYCLR